MKLVMLVIAFANAVLLGKHIAHQEWGAGAISLLLMVGAAVSLRRKEHEE